jgi:hypothetical protein
LDSFCGILWGFTEIVLRVGWVWEGEGEDFKRASGKEGKGREAGYTGEYEVEGREEGGGRKAEKEEGGGRREEEGGGRGMEVH